MADKIVWNSSFALGVDEVDSAHQGLFTAVNRLHKLIHEQDRNEWACVQGIKYFKTYTVRHFAEEEAYMKSIGYADYERHRKIHQNMRDVIIPGLERDMEASNYSVQSVERFLEAAVDWLRDHIMIEDKAIVGKGARA